MTPPPTVEIMHPPELRTRRSELLNSAGMSEEALRSLAEDYMLPAHLVAVVDELDEITFLLGG